MNVQLVIVQSDWSVFKSVQWGPKSLLGLPGRAPSITIEELKDPAQEEKEKKAP